MKDERRGGGPGAGGLRVGEWQGVRGSGGGAVESESEMEGRRQREKEAGDRLWEMPKRSEEDMLRGFDCVWESKVRTTSNQK